MATASGAMQLAASCSEEELVAAVRAGDDRAFETLYARYRVRISAYILGMVHDHARAEDIAQDVFISALRGLRDTERAIVFKPWLYEIAKNACIDEFRRTRRAREVPLDGDRDDADGGSGPVIAGGATPDSEVETKQRLDDLRGAFHGLSESHHKIIVMRELAGLSYDEIGQRLGMSKPMVESTLFRARRKLGEEYDDLVSGRRCERVQSAIEAGGERPLPSLGVRERRRVARHLSHCQPCRRLARMAGVDESFFQAPTLIGKIAALLPIPAWLRWRRSGGDGDERVGGVAGIHPAALQSMQVASRLADPAAPGYGLGRATATAAAIVLAGAGGGFVAGLGGGSRPAIRAPHRHVAPAMAPSPKRTTGHTSAAGRVRRAGSFRAKKSTVGDRRRRRRARRVDGEARRRRLRRRWLERRQGQHRIEPSGAEWLGFRLQIRLQLVPLRRDEPRQVDRGRRRLEPELRGGVRQRRRLEGDPDRFRGHQDRDEHGREHGVERGSDGVERDEHGHEHGQQHGLERGSDGVERHEHGHEHGQQHGVERESGGVEPDEYRLEHREQHGVDRRRGRSGPLSAQTPLAAY